MHLERAPPNFQVPQGVGVGEMRTSGCLRRRHGRTPQACLAVSHPFWRLAGIALSRQCNARVASKNPLRKKGKMERGSSSEVPRRIRVQKCEYVILGERSGMPRRW